MDQNKPTTPLPPKIPEALPALERAIMLLGSRAKTDLGSKPKGELELLLGVYPSVPQAVKWKTALSKLRKERVDAQPKPIEEDDEPNGNR